MADSTLAALTAAASPLTGAELLYGTQSGADRKLTAAQIVGQVSVVTTTDPSTANNAAAGYFNGQTWMNTTTGKRWVCTNATTGLWTLMGYSPIAGYLASTAYWPWGGVSPATGTAIATGKVYFSPFVLPQRMQVQGLFARVAAAPASAANAYIGIWAADATNGLPSGLPVATTVSFAVSNAAAANYIAALTANTWLEAGTLYYFGVVVDVSMTWTVPANFQWAALLGATYAAGAIANSALLPVAQSELNYPGSYASGLATLNLTPTFTGGTFTISAGTARGAAVWLIGV